LIQVCYFGAYLVFCLPASFVASRFSYRTAILMGLALYTIGAILFWPAAHYAVFWPFPCCAFIIGCGLATLETTAKYVDFSSPFLSFPLFLPSSRFELMLTTAFSYSSYISVLGSPERAAFRLNFAQSFNGLATFVGPTIAAHTFFKDPDSVELTSVQYVYLAVACLGAAVAVLFFFAKLPEITGDDLEDAQENRGIVDNRPLWKRKHTILGFICQFCYVGAQVTVATFCINLLTEHADYTDAQASSMFGYSTLHTLSRPPHLPLFPLHSLFPPFFLPFFGLSLWRFR
jgi:FHS family L-fucose permease-like MFS transporter